MSMATNMNVSLNSLESSASDSNSKTPQIDNNYSSSSVASLPSISSSSSSSLSSSSSASSPVAPLLKHPLAVLNVSPSAAAAAADNDYSDNNNNSSVSSTNDRDDKNVLTSELHRFFRGNVNVKKCAHDSTNVTLDESGIRLLAINGQWREVHKLADKIIHSHHQHQQQQQNFPNSHASSSSSNSSSASSLPSSSPTSCSPLLDAALSDSNWSSSSSSSSSLSSMPSSSWWSSPSSSSSSSSSSLSSPSPGSVLSPDSYLRIVCWSIVSLMRLRKFEAAQSILTRIGPFFSDDKNFQFYPDLYHKNQTGNMVPFTLHLLRSELPHYLGRTRHAIELLANFNAYLQGQLNKQLQTLTQATECMSSTSPTITISTTTNVPPALLNSNNTKDNLYGISRYRNPYSGVIWSMSGCPSFLPSLLLSWLSQSNQCQPAKREYCDGNNYVDMLIGSSGCNNGTNTNNPSVGMLMERVIIVKLRLAHYLVIDGDISAAIHIVKKILNDFNYQYQHLQLLFQQVGSANEKNHLSWWEDESAANVLLSITTCSVLIASLLGRMFLQAGDLNSACDTFNQAADTYTQYNANKTIYNNTKHLLLREENVVRIIEVNHSLIRIARSDYLAAYHMLSQLITKYPQDQVLVNNYAISCLYTNRISEAVNTLENGIRINPTRFLSESVVGSLRSLYDLSCSNPQSKRRLLEAIVLMYGRDDLDLAAFAT